MPSPPRRSRAARARVGPAVIDCDIHNAPASDQALAKYLARALAAAPLETFGLRGHRGATYSRRTRRRAHRLLAALRPASGSDLPFMREQLSDCGTSSTAS